MSQAYFARLVKSLLVNPRVEQEIWYNILYHIIDCIYILGRERGWSSWSFSTFYLRLKCIRPFFQRGLASRTCPPAGKAKLRAWVFWYRLSIEFPESRPAVAWPSRGFIAGPIWFPLLLPFFASSLCASCQCVLGGSCLLRIIHDNYCTCSVSQQEIRNTE